MHHAYSGHILQVRPCPPEQNTSIFRENASTACAFSLASPHRYANARVNSQHLQMQAHVQSQAQLQSSEDRGYLVDATASISVGGYDHAQQSNRLPSNVFLPTSSSHFSVFSPHIEFVPNGSQLPPHGPRYLDTACDLFCHPATQIPRYLLQHDGMKIEGRNPFAASAETTNLQTCQSTDCKYTTFLTMPAISSITFSHRPQAWAQLLPCGCKLCRDCITATTTGSRKVLNIAKGQAIAIFSCVSCGKRVNAFGPIDVDELLPLRTAFVSADQIKRKEEPVHALAQPPLHRQPVSPAFPASQFGLSAVRSAATASSPPFRSTIVSSEPVLSAQHSPLQHVNTTHSPALIISGSNLPTPELAVYSPSSIGTSSPETFYSPASPLPHIFRTANATGKGIDESRPGGRNAGLGIRAGLTPSKADRPSFNRQHRAHGLNLNDLTAYSLQRHPSNLDTNEGDGRQGVELNRNDDTRNISTSSKALNSSTKKGDGIPVASSFPLTPPGMIGSGDLATKAYDSPIRDPIRRNSHEGFVNTLRVVGRDTDKNQDREEREGAQIASPVLQGEWMEGRDVSQENDPIIEAITYSTDSPRSSKAGIPVNDSSHNIAISPLIGDQSIRNRRTNDLSHNPEDRSDYTDSNRGSKRGFSRGSSSSTHRRPGSASSGGPGPPRLREELLSPFLPVRFRPTHERRVVEEGDRKKWWVDPWLGHSMGPIRSESAGGITSVGRSSRSEWESAVARNTEGSTVSWPILKVRSGAPVFESFQGLES